MKSKSLLIIFVVLALLLSSFPAFAADGTVKVVVTNKSDSAGKITLSGPAYYSFDLKVGKNRFNVTSGTYSYSFFGCGRYQYGTFDATRNNAKLTVDCEAAAGSQTISLKVNNQSGEAVSLVLTGSKYYRFDVKKGTNVFDISDGQYTYSYNACGSEESGKLKLSKKGANLKIGKCKSSKSSAGGGMNVKVSNDTGGTLTIVMTGPNSYSFTLAPGNSTIKVLKGTYTYTVYSVCGSLTETKNFNKPMRWTWWCN